MHLHRRSCSRDLRCLMRWWTSSMSHACSGSSVRVSTGPDNRHTQNTPPQANHLTCQKPRAPPIPLSLAAPTASSTPHNPNPAALKMTSPSCHCQAYACKARPSHTLRDTYRSCVCVPRPLPNHHQIFIPTGNLDAQHLRSLTYLVFLTGTSQDPDEGLLRLMRRQLKVRVCMSHARTATSTRQQHCYKTAW